MRIQIAEGAEQDFDEAYWFYAKASKSTAEAFEREFGAILDLIDERPSIGSPHAAGTRRKHFSHFPYSVIYVPDRGRITVIAVMHARRDPLYWLDRIPGS